MKSLKKNYHDHYAERTDRLDFFLKVGPSVAVLFILLFIGIGSYNSAIGTSIFLMIALLSAALRKDKYSFQASFILAFAFMLEPMVVICFSNGLESPYIVWLIVPIYANSTLIGKKGTLTSGFMTLVFFITIAIFQKQIASINELAPIYYSFVYVFSFVSAVLLMCFFAWRNIFKIENYVNTQKSMLEIADKNNKALLKNEAEQERLLSIISHELRTPAAIIDMTLDQNNSDIDVSLLRKTTGHLMDVLEDMRMIKEPEVLLNTPVKRACISSLLKESVDLVSSITADKQLEITIKEASGLINESLLKFKLVKQISMNIIKNCINHAQASSLDINIESFDIGNAIKYQISFSDNGKGVVKEKIPMLFNAFEKGEVETSGSGLGLHLSKKFAREGLGGNLEYVEKPVGATFVLELVAQKYIKSVNSGAESKVAAKHLSLDGFTILLAEDNQVISMMTKKLLENKGTNVLTALDGVSALNIFENSKIDCVLTDIFMPNLNGYQLTEKLRTSGFQGLIVACTAATLGEEVDQILACGANKTFTKPLQIDDFVLYLNNSLNKPNKGKVVHLNSNNSSSNDSAL